MLRRRKSKKVDIEALKEAVIAVLHTIFDPEIPVNIYDLGLIYDVTVDEKAHVDIQMTLTTPGCPVAQTFPMTIQNKVSEVEGIKSVSVEVVWDPPWTPERMTEVARVQLGFF